MPRFWASKAPAEEVTSWSVILSALKSELEKKRVSEKISELFGLSFEEARELVQNTPLILLDDLSRPAADEVQGIFRQIRAETNVTCDSLVKRRCYRAVWPEPPSLSFLKSVSTGKPAERIPEEFPVKTKIEAAVSPEPAEIKEPSFEPFQNMEERYRELESLYEVRMRENQELKEGFEQALRDQAEKTAAELRSTVEDWEGRTQSLREEYQETKKIYEEKVMTYEKEFAALKSQLKEIEIWKEKAADLEKQNRQILEKLKEFESDKETLGRTVKERSEEMGLWREKYQTLAQKLERLEGLHEEEKKRRTQAEEAIRQASETADQTRRQVEQEFSRLSDEQASEIRRLKETNRELMLQLESAQRQTRELLGRVEEQQLIEKRSRLTNEIAQKETRLRELSLDTERIRQEVRERELTFQTLMTEQSDLECEILEARQTQRRLLEQSKLKEKNIKLKYAPRSLGAEEGEVV